MDHPSEADFEILEALVVEGHDMIEAAHAMGWTTSAFRRADSRRHADIKQYWHHKQAEEDRRVSRNTLREIAQNPDVEPKDRNRSAELLGRSSGYIRDTSDVNLSGGLEINSPDVANAIEQFTARVVSLAAGGDAGAHGLAAAGLGEGEAGVPVAELDRAPEPGAA